MKKISTKEPYAYNGQLHTRERSSVVTNILSIKKDSLLKTQKHFYIVR